MNNSALFWSATCLLLAVTYVATADKQTAGSYRFRPPAVTQSDIDRIELEGQQRVVLLRKQGNWWLQLPTVADTQQQVLASADQISQLWRSLTGLQHDYLASQHPDTHNHYGVGQPPTKGTVRLLKGDQLQWSMLIGNIADEFGRRHVRLASSPHVAVVRGAWQNLQSADREQWRNNKVLAGLRAASVQHIAVSNKQQHAFWTLRLQPKQHSWQVTQPQQLPTNYQLNQDRVQQLLQSLLQLQAHGFVDDAQAQQQAKQQLASNAAGHIDITLESGKRYTLRFIRAHTAMLPADLKERVAKQQHGYAIAQLQGGQDNTLYLLRQQHMDNASPNLTALRDWSLWHLEPKNMQQVSVQHAQQEPVVLAKQGKQWRCTQPAGQPPENVELDEQHWHEQLLRLCTLQTQGPAPKSQQQPLHIQLLQSGTRIALKDTKGNTYAARFLKASTPKTAYNRYYVVKEQDQDTTVYLLQGQDNDLYGPSGLAALHAKNAKTPP